MLLPCYPHARPDAAQPQRPIASAVAITGLPPLAKFAGDVVTWFDEMGVVPKNPPLDISRAGTVLVVGNMNDSNQVLVGGNNTTQHKCAEIFNGSIPVASATHARWLDQCKAVPEAHLCVSDGGAAFWTGANEMYCQSAARGGFCNGYYDKDLKRIFINAHVDDGSTVVHEYMHTFDGDQEPSFLYSVDEGLTEFFARDASARFQLKYKGLAAYDVFYATAKKLVDRIGLDVVAKLKFGKPDVWLDALHDLLKRLHELTFNEYERLCEPQNYHRLPPLSVRNPKPMTIDECVDTIASLGRKDLNWPARHWEVKQPPRVKI